MNPKAKESYPLLDLLDQRWNEYIKDMPDPTQQAPAKRPVYAPEFKTELRKVAHEHGEAHNSDPFAAGRALRYMQQGYWSPSEVRKDAADATKTRRSQGVTFPSVRLAA